MPLHVDYRPKTLDEFMGNATLKTVLDSILTGPDRPTTFLFEGLRGCGKTTLARIIASRVGANEFNTHEYDLAETRGIDQARDLKGKAFLMPLGTQFRVFILDEIQDSTSNFQSAVLKLLEEPPKHAVFILCTTEPEKLKPTILDRCTRFKVKPLHDPEIRELLHRVLEAEGVANFPAEAITKISHACEGIPRLALTLLGKVIDLEDNAQILEAIDAEVLAQTAVRDLCQALDEHGDWARLAGILTGLQKENVESLRNYVLKYFCNNMLKNKRIHRAAEVISWFEDSFYTSGYTGLVHACFRCTDKGDD